MSKKSDKEMMLRIIDSAYIDHCWKGAEKVYGKEATEMLRSVAPADPFLLRDMAIFSHITDGKTKKEAKALVDNYTHDEWVICLVKYILHNYFITKTKNRLTSD